MSAAPRCPVHHVPLTCAACGERYVCAVHHVTLTCAACTGAHGGQASSPAKTAAARRNARRPRPRKGQGAQPER